MWLMIKAMSLYGFLGDLALICPYRFCVWLLPAFAAGNWYRILHVEGSPGAIFIWM